MYVIICSGSAICPLFAEYSKHLATVCDIVIYPGYSEELGSGLPFIDRYILTVCAYRSWYVVRTLFSVVIR